ncbi:MAG: hypothetical protein AB7U85_00535 [Alphaproteobacteria bacterium]
MTDTNKNIYVGIFWFKSLELICDKTLLDNAVSYGVFLIHDKGHVDFWEEMELKTGFSSVFHDFEYDEVPRGRVSYHVPEKRFYIYADRKLLKKSIMQKIINEFGLLRQNYIIKTDSHYRT